MSCKISLSCAWLLEVSKKEGMMLLLLPKLVLLNTVYVSCVTRDVLIYTFLILVWTELFKIIEAESSSEQVLLQIKELDTFTNINIVQ